MNNDKDITKVRLHDGIVGILNIGSILLASKFGFDWIYVAAAVAILQILSPITKFCPRINEASCTQWVSTFVT